jgi:hypothetical protein
MKGRRVVERSGQRQAMVRGWTTERPAWPSGGMAKECHGGEIFGGPCKYAPCGQPCHTAGIEWDPDSHVQGDQHQGT